MPICRIVTTCSFMSNKSFLCLLFTKLVIFLKNGFFCKFCFNRETLNFKNIVTPDHLQRYLNKPKIRQTYSRRKW